MINFSLTKLRTSASEMTYIVSGGALNSTRSLTQLRTWVNVIFLCVCYTATVTDNVTLLTYSSNCLIV